MDHFDIPFDDGAGSCVNGEFVLRAAIDDFALVLRAPVIIVQLPLVNVAGGCAGHTCKNSFLGIGLADGSTVTGADNNFCFVVGLDDFAGSNVNLIVILCAV